MRFGSEKLRIKKLISSQDLRPLARITDLNAYCSELSLPAFVESFIADLAQVRFPPLVSVLAFTPIQFRGCSEIGKVPLCSRLPYDFALISCAAAAKVGREPSLTNAV